MSCSEFSACTQHFCCALILEYRSEIIITGGLDEAVLKRVWYGKPNDKNYVVKKMF